MTEPDIKKITPIKFSEDYIADRFVERFGKKLRYSQCTAQGWLTLENGSCKLDLKLKSQHLKEPEFWSKEIKESRGLSLSREWIPDEICDFLRSVFKNDDAPMPADALN